MDDKEKIILGFLGARLDAGFNPKRWERWRPTVALSQFEDLPVARFEILYQPDERDLAHRVSRDITSCSPETTVQLHQIELVDPWDLEEVFGKLFEFASEYEFNTEQYDYLFNITTGTHVEQICLFLLAESRHLPGCLIQASPPPQKREGNGRYRVIDLDLSRYDAINARFHQEMEQGLEFLKSGIETRNSRFNHLIEQIERVAIASRSPMLITGPTGAGKTQLVRRIYELKRHREQIQGPFVEVNCATLRGDQSMSSLFGHVKGAFTGAEKSREGLLKSADSGMLFLDEIGELGLDEQAMLLRAIEDKRFLPVGSDREVESDFQLIAGTNRDLQDSVQAGSFREDLLARINLWTFPLPGLAERREDIAPNVEYELKRFTTTTGRNVTFNVEAKKQFLQFAESTEAGWSSNFRDLNAAITRMATLAEKGRIHTELVTEEIDRLKQGWHRSEDQSTDILSHYLEDEQIATLDLFDQSQLASVLEVCREAKSLSAAGRKLFAVSRQSKQKPNDADRLRKYLAKFDLSWSDLQDR